MIRRYRPVNRPFNRSMLNRNTIPDFPLVPEPPTYVIEVKRSEQFPAGDPAPLASPQSPVAESPLPKVERSEVDQVVVTSEPEVQPIKSASRPKSPKKYKKRSLPKPKRILQQASVALMRNDASPLSPHERRCTICNHPDRDAIEEEFLQWQNVYSSADAHQIEWRSIYRHAHALGLFEQRDRNVRFSLGHIIHRAQNVPATADSVIRAVRAFTRINRSGEWVEPPTRVIVSSGAQTTPSPDVIEVTPPSDEPSVNRQ